jgi:2-phosphoglycerate kinase
VPSPAERLKHVRWIGGGSGAGKSTVGRELAETHGLRLYGTDDAIAEHVLRSDPLRHPLTAAFLGMSMDERWLNRTPAEMARTFHGFHGEMFEMIVEDLLALPDQPPILVEGFRLLPRLVAPLLSQPGQAVWLLPTPAFRRQAFDTRGSRLTIAGRTSDPDRALENLLARDALFTDELERQTADLGLPLLRVDIGSAPGDLENQVAAVLGLARDFE